MPIALCAALFVLAILRLREFNWKIKALTLVRRMRNSQVSYKRQDLYLPMLTMLKSVCWKVPLSSVLLQSDGTSFLNNRHAYSRAIITTLKISKISLLHATYFSFILIYIYICIIHVLARRVIILHSTFPVIYRH
jgi:hypothetical protein